jgi:transcriptional regulator with XRE-family HTH domain
MVAHFNRALDDLRGSGTERDLARRLGISEDALARYRKGHLPKNVRRLRQFPQLFQALADDASAATAAEQPHPSLQTYT